MPGFFSNVKSIWNSHDSIKKNGYSELRSKYAKAIPLPSYGNKYFTAIDSIADGSKALALLIYNPLWLGINALLFTLKTLLACIATALLLVPAVLVTICAPRSSLTDSTNSAFKLAAAHAVVGAAMAFIAAGATLLSILFNPICLITRGIQTIIEEVKDVGSACCCP